MKAVEHKLQNAPEETIALTIGTAGHIDHGKTALVKLLTGCDCDTMPEEKTRGMTIDLGFAACRLSDNRRVGIVDVPGHERFIHNMVAGAAGIDVVILVIAADDGIMPQTLEHFHIVRLLGISSGMIALTKIDLVNTERIAEVTRQIRELVGGSFLENCPIIPISSKTGQGFDAFSEALVVVADGAARKNVEGAFRMHVESTFVIQGIGAIISGIPSCGTIRVGDTLELLPRSGEKKVRGLQVYGKDMREGRAGECVAVRLGNLSSDEAERGMVLATPKYFTSTRIVNARLYLLPKPDFALKPRMGIRFYVGTTESTGYMVLPDLTLLAAERELCVQFQLACPVVAAPGDFFVVRSLNPVQTIGGGNVISADQVKMRRSKGNWANMIAEHEKAYRDPFSALSYVLNKHGAMAQHIGDLAKAAMLSMDAARKYIQVLVRQKSAIALAGERYASEGALKIAQASILNALQGLHTATPMSMGFAKKELFRDIQLDRLLIEKAFDLLLESGKITACAAGFQIPECKPQLTPIQCDLKKRINKIYLQTGFASPRRDELPQMLGATNEVVAPLFDYLLQTGEIVALADNVILHQEWLEKSKQKLTEYIVCHGAIESGVFKTVLGTTRKYSIPILEYWDAKGLTRRVGNNRYLKN